MNTIDLIDIRNRDGYTVVTEFVPENFTKPPETSPISPTSPITSSKTTSQTTIIIASVFGTVGLLIVIGSIFFFIRFYRNWNAIPTPSS